LLLLRRRLEGRSPATPRDPGSAAAPTRQRPLSLSGSLTAARGGRRRRRPSAGADAATARARAPAARLL